MKVKCPKCGHEFEIEGVLVKFPKVEPDTSGSSIVPKIDMKKLPKIESYYEGDIASELIPIDTRSLLYCGPYKEIHLSCGHIIRCEFAQFYKGQKTWCPDCKKEVEVIKCINTVTGEECDRL